MFLLVLFLDGVYYICKEKDIKKHVEEKFVSVRYKSYGRFEAEVIAENESKEFLTTLKLKLEAEKADSAAVAEREHHDNNNADVHIYDPVLPNETDVSEREEELHDNNASVPNCDPVVSNAETEVVSCTITENNNNEFMKGEGMEWETLDIECIDIDSTPIIMHQDVLIRPKFDPSSNVSSAPVFTLTPPYQDIELPHSAEDCNDSLYIPNQSDYADSSSENIQKNLQISETSATQSAPDDGGMFVSSVESGRKRDFCIYCQTEQAKLSRHLIRQHKDKERVMELLTHSKGSKERKEIFSTIRKNGQFFFNTNNSVNTGERKVTRRPNAKFGKTATDFVTCPSCCGDYAKTSLRHHFRRCNTSGKTKQRNILVKSRQMVGRIHKKASDVLRKKVFPTLQEDNVTKEIRYDELVILFGNKLCQKYRDPHFYDMIRQKLRQLGRFLLEIKKFQPKIESLFDVFYPKNYDNTILAVQSLAGLNESGTGFKTPSLATSIGTLLKQVGLLCISVWIKSQEKQKQTFAEDFVKLLTEDYGANINRTALETQTKNKRQSKVVLPLKEDIQKLQSYLRDSLRANYAILIEHFCETAWLKLAETALISIQLFNRRRAGEIERILIDDFSSFEKIDEKSIGEAFHNFTLEEKQAAQKYVRFTIRGKLNRTVPVLLHREVLVCLQTLLRYRSEAHVSNQNPYLFGIPGILKGDHKYLSACRLIRKFANDCGAKQPETLRGTVLRKHVATMCANFNLQESEVADLASFMGHADKVHKEIYRQPILTREILHISKLLEAVQGNNDEDSDIDSDGGEENDPALANVNTSQESPTASQNEDENEDEVTTPPYGKCRRVRWTTEERRVATETFKDCLSSNKLPSFHRINEMIAAHPGVFKRGVATIKTWVKNEQFKKQKRQS
ncbi:hypothetical protein JTB14_022663 [Gonioctena quinquepunctata]|nr:hypothetical protein JTB14_022663 [Gonioctena quinquepunctata]